MLPTRAQHSPGIFSNTSVIVFAFGKTKASLLASDEIDKKIPVSQAEPMN